MPSLQDGGICFGAYPALRCASRWAKFGRSLWERVHGVVEFVESPIPKCEGPHPMNEDLSMGTPDRGHHHGWLKRLWARVHQPGVLE